MIRVGFTGTRHGMSPTQIEAVVMIMKRVASIGMVLARHGDCVGADEDFHDIARSVSAFVEIHPGSSSAMRGHSCADRTRAPSGFLERNRRIVDLSALVIATPFEPTHRDRGGTWYTVDHALKCKKPLALVLPRRNGVEIEFSGGWRWPDLPKEMPE